MDEIIKPHSFEEAKNHIQSFSERTSDELALDTVDTDGGLFGWFDHNVTGEELNSITAQIQDYLISFNSLHSDFIKEFGQVYKALESLDKEYIPAIMSAVKGAEFASDRAKAAQADIKKTIEAQNKIICVLEAHKEKLDKLEHLNNIDELWSDSKFTRTIVNENAEAIREHDEGLRQLNDELNEERKQFSTVLGKLKRKLMLSYIVSGSALAMGIIELIIILVKVS